MPNPFCHIELNTTDLGAAKTFYGNLFDWQLQEVPNAGYTFIKVGNGTGGGMNDSPRPWRAVLLARLRPGRRHQGLHRQSQSPRCNHHERCHGRHGTRPDERPHRSHRRCSGPVAARCKNCLTQPA